MATMCCRCAGQLTIIGFDAAAKARRTAGAILRRTRAMLARLGMDDYTAVHVDLLGGPKPYAPWSGNGFEAVLWLAVAHRDRRALELFAREIAPAATSWAPGTTGAFGRPAVAPLVRQASFLIDKALVHARVTLSDGAGVARNVPLAQAVPRAAGACDLVTAHAARSPAQERVLPAYPPGPPVPHRAGRKVPLMALARARSGDKGDTSNIGVIARRAQDMALLRELLTEAAVAAWLSPLVLGKVTRHELPGIHAFNFVCAQALAGGGMASLRNDPLGKGLAKILLAMPVPVPGDYPVTE